MSADLKVVKFKRKPDERSVHANDVLAQFAAEAETASTSTEHMAGFAITTWDDEGFMQVAFYFGEMNPLPAAMIPNIVKDHLTAALVQ